mmetsp:Transcript_16920/g.32050  ORF Transcript_16920/g.32050 Transcript_16920/m.32050 type:complete len:220 (+) Transcript_16920:320-979(+)
MSICFSHRDLLNVIFRWGLYSLLPQEKPLRLHRLEDLLSRANHPPCKSFRFQLSYSGSNLLRKLPHNLLFPWHPGPRMSPRSPPVPPSPPTAEPNLLDGGGAPACLRALFADEGGGLEELGEIGHLLVVALGGESVSFFLLLHAEVLPLSSRASSFLARLDVGSPPPRLLLLPRGERKPHDVLQYRRRVPPAVRILPFFVHHCRGVGGPPQPRPSPPEQ